MQITIIQRLIKIDIVIKVSKFQKFQSEKINKSYMIFLNFP